ncbi:choice-of-anchor H family protein [Steroidobacter sp. S1-65]|uniref:Choice-of-anchor H family protein n=1 Tax=Steroidobacter gossypii TaxID=2805490 RepID=A0ABS1WRY2_9GAMM|nr:choice-of-anchor H family protein [Steroidobacter gossypii]MBM0103736.1 choice-of-anchor H family protein [Steroidobacter gossypii]
MKSAVAAGVMMFCVAMLGEPAHAGEGRVSDAPPRLEPGRVSNYAGAKSAAPVDAESGKAHANAKTVQPKAARSKTIRPAISQAWSHRAEFFYIYDARSQLRRDRDVDGYHSEFQIRFDADSEIGDALVYARLYMRRVGEVDWVLYHTTDDFWIYGKTDDDEYYVTTALDDGFATSEYDILIDLYEVGHSGIIATLDASDDVDLFDLPLEEVGLDVPIAIPGYAIGGVSTTLLIDSDGDDHYSRFRIAFDPDADFDGTYVYARFWVRPQGGDWIEEHVSEDFLVDSSGGADVYELTADWISGYPTAYYDVQIDLHDAATGGLVASAGSERPELSRLPLEDQARDTRAGSPPPGGGGGDTSSREGGGGASNLWLLLALSLLAVARRRQS